MKLPLSIKQILTFRKPQSNLSPSLERLGRVFTPTLNEAIRHEAQNGWLVLVTCTLLAANVPSAVGHLYRYVSRREAWPSTHASLLPTEDRTAQASLMREAAVKCAIFVGVPRTILSLEALTGALEDDVKAALRKVSHREANAENIETFMQRGRDLWKDIYTPHDVKLATKLGSYHPDFPSFVIQSYGTVLSPWPPNDPAHEPGNVNRTLTSIVGVACLRTEGGVGPQLVSHVYGLLKAGEYHGEPLKEGDRWLSSEEGTEWAINTVDKLCDVVRENDNGARSKL